MKAKRLNEALVALDAARTVIVEALAESTKSRQNGARVKARADAFAENLRPFFEQAIADGLTLEGIAERLTREGKRTSSGVGKWHLFTITQLLKRLELKTRPANVFAEKLRPMLSKAAADGATLQEVADQLNREGVRTRLGGEWHARSVLAAFDRLGLRDQWRLGALERRRKAAVVAKRAKAERTRRARKAAKPAAKRVEARGDFSDLLGDIGGRHED